MKDPGEYLNLVRRRWPVVALAVLLACLAAWVVTPSAEEEATAPRYAAYSATHVLHRDPGTDRKMSLEAMAFFATTGEIPRRVVAVLGEDVEPTVLAAQVSVTADKELGTLTVSTVQDDPDRAVELATVFAQETVAHFDEQERRREEEALEALAQRLENQEQSIREHSRQLVELPEGSTDAILLQAEVDALIRQYSTNLDRYEQLQDQPSEGVGLYTLEEAVAVPVVDDEAVFAAPQGRGIRVPIAGAVGLVLGLLLIVVLDRVDTRIRTRQDAELAFHLPVVSEVPRFGPWYRRRHAVVTDPASASAEAYRAMRLALQLMPRRVLKPTDPGVTVDKGALPNERDDLRKDKGAPQVILVSSPGSGEGKSTTAANLAASFAEIGKSVLVLDCDVQQPTVHRHLQVPLSQGVTDYLAAADQPPLTSFVVATSIPGVRLMPSGTPWTNPGELLGKMKDLVAEARAVADVVIVDTPPLLQATGSVALAPDADAVIVVARSSRTAADSARQAREILARVGAQVLGVALVATPQWAVQQYYRRTGRGAERSGTAKWPSSALGLNSKESQ